MQQLRGREDTDCMEYCKVTQCSLGVSAALCVWQINNSFHTWGLVQSSVLLKASPGDYEDLSNVNGPTESLLKLLLWFVPKALAILQRFHLFCLSRLMSKPSWYIVVAHTLSTFNRLVLQQYWTLFMALRSFGHFHSSSNSALRFEGKRHLSLFIVTPEVLCSNCAADLLMSRLSCHFVMTHTLRAL